MGAQQSPPPATPPPSGAWSKTGRPFHPKAHFCGHCNCEIPPGDKMWFKGLLVMCQTCFPYFFPQYRN